MIRLESVSKSYPNGVLFNNVNISINKGMRVGLVGKNGSGKSTLLKLILKKEPLDTGSIQIQKALKIGYLSQDVVEESGVSVMDEVKRGYPKILELEKVESVRVEVEKVQPPVDAVFSNISVVSEGKN